MIVGFDPPVIVYDAGSLYPFHTRNLSVQFRVERLVQLSWKDVIHDEWIRNLAAASPAIPLERLYTVRDLMNRVLPSADVRGYEYQIPSLHLPDPDDRHVVAAGIVAGATQIITWNIRDFPANVLSEHGLQAQTPDSLLMELYGQIPETVAATTAKARQNLRRNTVPPAAFLEALNRQGLRRFADAMQLHNGDL